jgi:hypothetical protein
MILMVSPIETIKISVKCFECRRTFDFTFTEENSSPLTAEGAERLGIKYNDRQAVKA